MSIQTRNEKRKEMRNLTDFSKDNRGQSRIQDGIEIFIALLVGGLLAAFLLPIAINELVNVSTSTWGSAEASIWDLLPLFMVFAVFLMFVAWAVSVYRQGQ